MVRYTLTPRNSLRKFIAGVSWDTDILSFPNANADILDAALAKCNFSAATDPTVDDDEADGYATGSRWHNTTDHTIFVCESATEGEAVWRQVWPALAVDMDLSDYQLVSGMSAYQLSSVLTTRGDIPFRGAAAWERLAKGTSGQFLKQGANDPVWATFAPADVTFAATAKILGRKTAGGGAGEECSLDELLDLIGSPAQGDIIYRGASAYARLAAGTAGQVLMSGGASANPSWDSSRIDGWVAAPTLTYSAADAPVYMVTISGDYSAIITAGMRIKLTDDSAVKYFIVVKSAYSEPNTTLTLYGGTDYALSGGAISSPFYSMVKAPAGFPLDPAKWTVSATLSGVQSNPTINVVYNLGSSNIVVPIGCWRLIVKAHLQISQSSGSSTEGQAGMSTANNSFSSDETKALFYADVPNIINNFSLNVALNLSTKTTYYFVACTAKSSTLLIQINQANGTVSYAYAVCAYL